VFPQTLLLALALLMLLLPLPPLLLLQVKRGVLYTWHEAEGKRLKNPFDTITEGVGLNRLTANFAAGAVDDAVRVSDREAVEMAAYLLK
jgi:cysteine synthase A